MTIPIRSPQFEYKNGIAKRIDTSNIELTPEDHKRIKLKINNKEGFNQHTDKKLLAKNQPKELTEFEAFKQKLGYEQKAEVKRLGNELYMKLRELRPLKIKFTRFKNYYEAQHFGWEWEE